MQCQFLLRLSILCLVCYGCSSDQKRPRKFKLSYQVIDAQQAVLPQWTDHPRPWAEKHDKKDIKDHRYFIYHTDLKNSRSLACKIATANATAIVAGEISQTVKESLGHGVEGDTSNTDEKLEEYVESTLTRQIQSAVVGARVHRTYWEERSYRKDLGAKQDRQGFTCAVLVKIKQKEFTTIHPDGAQKIRGSR